MTGADFLVGFSIVRSQRKLKRSNFRKLEIFDVKSGLLMCSPSSKMRTFAYFNVKTETQVLRGEKNQT